MKTKYYDTPQSKKEFWDFQDFIFRVGCISMYIGVINKLKECKMKGVKMIRRLIWQLVFIYQYIIITIKKAR